MYNDKILQLGKKKAKMLAMVLFLVFSFGFLNTVVVYALDCNLAENAELGVCKIKLGATATNVEAGFSDKSVSEQIGIVVGAGLSLLGIIFFVLMIYGGVTWMLAQGNEQEVQKAKDTIKAAIIGLIIVFASFALTSFLGAELSSFK